MKTNSFILSSLLALIFAVSPKFSFAEKFKLDTSHTTVGFKIKHIMISNVNGKFNKFTGSFDFDEKAGKIDNLEVSIDTSSIDTNQAERDKHLKSKDFFDVEHFSAMKFVGKKYIFSGRKPVKVSGDLTIRDITKPVVLTVDYKGSATDPWGNHRLAFSATSRINRKDFGLNWNKTLDSGGVFISDEVSILIDGEALLESDKK